MQSRRDQIQAHSFTVGRVTSGVLRVDLDGPDQPVARTGRGALTGLVLAVLGAVVVALYGVIVPGAGAAAATWQKDGTLVIDSGSGARFLFLGGLLRPVPNVTSALLATNGQMTVAAVADSALQGVPRGAPLGVADVPDAPPPAGALTAAPWTACESGAAGGAGRLVLRVGVPGAVTGLTSGQGVVVAAPDGTPSLLWDGRRLPLSGPHDAARALGYGGVAPTPVTAAFLVAVPAGPQLAPPQISGLGAAGPALGGGSTRVGQLFSDSSGLRYVLTQQGLEPLTATQFALLDGDPATQRQAYGDGPVTVRALGPADLAAHTAAGAPSGAIAAQGAALPPAPPAAVDVSGQSAVCVTLRSAGPSAGGQGVATSFGVAGAGAAASGALPAGQGPGIVPSCTAADLVAVPAGGGALVAAGPTEYLVAADGVRYPLAPGALQALGYGAAAPVVLPAAVVGLLPTGPPLDPAALAPGGVVTPETPAASCQD
jgi:type VII secretion protein EccB